MYRASRKGSQKEKMGRQVEENEIYTVSQVFSLIREKKENPGIF